jgi:antitoxin MazE
MREKIQKWGNSLALRIPSTFAREIGLVEETNVELRVRNRKIIVEPVPVEIISLTELLNGITEENIHTEIESGSAQGREA